MEWLRLVRFPLVSRLSWAWFVVSNCLLDCMLLKRRMSLPPPLALIVLLMLGLSGLARCPLQTLRWFLIFWMVWLVLTLPFTSFWARFRTMRRYLACRPEEVPLYLSYA